MTTPYPAGFCLSTTRAGHFTSIIYAWQILSFHAWVRTHYLSTRSKWTSNNCSLIVLIVTGNRRIIETPHFLGNIRLAAGSRGCQHMHTWVSLLLKQQMKIWCSHSFLLWISSVSSHPSDQLAFCIHRQYSNVILVYKHDRGQPHTLEAWGAFF
jgi:hypothetical protein